MNLRHLFHLPGIQIDIAKNGTRSSALTFSLLVTVVLIALTPLLLRTTCYFSKWPASSITSASNAPFMFSTSTSSTLTASDAGPAMRSVCVCMWDCIAALASGVAFCWFFLLTGNVLKPVQGTYIFFADSACPFGLKMAVENKVNFFCVPYHQTTDFSLARRPFHSSLTHKKNWNPIQWQASGLTVTIS